MRLGAVTYRCVVRLNNEDDYFTIARRLKEQDCDFSHQRQEYERQVEHMRLMIKEKQDMLDCLSGEKRFGITVRSGSFQATQLPRLQSGRKRPGDDVAGCQPRQPGDEVGRAAGAAQTQTVRHGFTGRGIRRGAFCGEEKLSSFCCSPLRRL